MSSADQSAVLAQLDLLLAHPLFCQSKRYPALLQFVVEQVLEGNGDQVKERLIGMEVFGRPPGYDANADPVVRVTAGEIRKRLAQYYYDPSHQGEIRIELPTGSYVPVFQRWSEPESGPELEEESLAGGGESGDEAMRALRGGEPGSALTLSEPAAGTPLPLGGSAGILGLGGTPGGNQSGYPPTVHHTTHLFLMVLLVGVTLLLGIGGGYGYWQYRQARIPVPVSVDKNVDDFWQPLTAGAATVTFCLGEPARDSSGDTDPAQAIHHAKLAEPLYFRLRQSGQLAPADDTYLKPMMEVLQRQHKAFRVSAASAAGFTQLREGPAVFIGAFDNLWTMRLTRDLRFGFDSIDGNAFILDRKSKEKTTWFTAWDLPYEKLSRDYAIVARLRDTLTGQPVMIVAGISEEGTEAAGELISDPTDLEALLKNAPPNWRDMNVEAVIETQVIDGHAGPPQVLAVEFW